MKGIATQRPLSRLWIGTSVVALVLFALAPSVALAEAIELNGGNQYFSTTGWTERWYDTTAYRAEGYSYSSHAWDNLDTTINGYNNGSRRDNGYNGWHWTDGDYCEVFAYENLRGCFTKALVYDTIQNYTATARYAATDHYDYGDWGSLHFYTSTDGAHSWGSCVYRPGC